MNKTILITGTSRGIGRYLAEKFLERGWIVYGCSRHDVEIDNKNYFHCILDVADEDEVKHYIKFIDKIDVLINNAGIASMNHFLLTTKKKAVEIMNTNFIGTFLFSREVAKLMLRQKKGGQIINFSSIATSWNIEGEAVYAASKAAVETFSQTISSDLFETGVNINCIAPGLVETDLTKNIPKNNIPKTTFENILKVIDEIIESDESGTIRPA